MLNACGIVPPHMTWHLLSMIERERSSADSLGGCGRRCGRRDGGSSSVRRSKIKHMSSFGKSESDDETAIERIIMTVNTVSLTASGAYLCRSIRHRYSAWRFDAMPHANTCNGATTIGS